MMKYVVVNNGNVDGVRVETRDSEDKLVSCATFLGTHAVADANAYHLFIDPQPLARRQLEQHHLLAALTEINEAGRRLADLGHASTFVDRPERGGIVALLDKACARVSRLGTDSPFNFTGLNPMEEACRALNFYANKAWEKPNISTEDKSAPYDKLLTDQGTRAREFLAKYGVPFAHVKRGE